MSKNIKLKIDWIGIPVDFMTFNGGEEHVKITKPQIATQSIVIETLITSSQDLIRLILLKDAVDEINVYNVKAKLKMPYAPYARQDRRCDTGEAFSLKVVARLINGMGFDEVVIVDPHSDVTPALIDNVRVISQDTIAFTDLQHSDCDIWNKDVILCAPDGGALKKTFKLGMALGCPVISAEKIRDMSNGKIIRTEVHSDDLTGKIVWMIDDICDGGMTFIKLAETLKAKGTKEVNLWVTHGVFSKGKEVLTEAGITKVRAKYDWTELGNS